MDQVFRLASLTSQLVSVLHTQQTLSHQDMLIFGGQLVIVGFQ
jgi:hypothetical protein